MSTTLHFDPWMRLLRMTAMVGFVFLFLRTVSSSCLQFELRREYSRAQAVFLGTVESTRFLESTDERLKLVRPMTAAAITVERQWKGPTAKTIEVSTCGALPATVCSVGMNFQPGARYLVFAYKHGDSLETSSCSAWRMDGAANRSERLAGEQQLRLLGMINPRQN